MCTQNEPIVFGSYLWIGTRWFLAIGSGINYSVDEDIGLPWSPANHINNHQNKQHHDSLFSLSCNSGLLCNCESIDKFSQTQVLRKMYLRGTRTFGWTVWVCSWGQQSWWSWWRKESRRSEPLVPASSNRKCVLKICLIFQGMSLCTKQMIQINPIEMSICSQLNNLVGCCAQGGRART